MVASGHGVSSRPVSTSLRPIIDCRKKGSETIASIWAQNEHIEVQIDRENSGCAAGQSATGGPASAAGGGQKTDNQHRGHFRKHERPDWPWQNRRGR
jgi:hypothetical protein